MKPCSSLLIGGALAAILCLCPGCVAFNVGKPVVIVDKRDIPEKQASPVVVNVIAVKPQHRQLSTETLSLGLKADVEETFDKRVVWEKWTIRKRKRLAVGLFPGAAEIYLMPDGALPGVIFHSQDSRGEYDSNPSDTATEYVEGMVLGGLLTCGVYPLLGTFYSVLAAPFDSWECRHDLFDPDYVKESAREGKWTTSGSPKLRLLNKHSRELGVHTCLDVSRQNSELAHVGLIGVHKYVAVSVDGPERSPPAVVGTETTRRDAEANGPYIVELSIPALNHYDWKRVSARDIQVSFPLPVAPHYCTTEAVVSFKEDEASVSGVPNELTRKALAKAAGQTFRFEVNLKGGGGEPVKLRKFYEVLGISPAGDGKYIVRVEIKDKSRTFSIARDIENEVKRLIREDYQGRNPDTPAKFIRETAQWKTENEGSVLVFTGWAFSVRPVEDGWSYDNNTRRGWVRLRITGGMPAEDAKRWARENIAAIVSEKNAAIDVGKAPPAGAQFRSLDENFSDGVLTVEFEAVQ